MKKLTSLLLCLFLLAAMAVPVLATAEQEATEPAEEFYDGLETAYVTWETVPSDMIEDGALYIWSSGDIGTYTIPADENGVIYWSTIETAPESESTIEYSNGEITAEGEIFSFQYNGGPVAEQSAIAPATGTVPTFLYVLILIVSVVLLGLAVLVFVAAVVIVLIALIISLIKKKKNKKSSQEEDKDGNGDVG